MSDEQRLADAVGRRRDVRYVWLETYAAAPHAGLDGR
jgi:hypothetical protein